MTTQATLIPIVVCLFVIIGYVGIELLIRRYEQQLLDHVEAIRKLSQG
jgi:hypothetical protein